MKKRVRKKRLLVISVITVIILFFAVIFLLNYFGVFEKMTGNVVSSQCSAGTVFSCPNGYSIMDSSVNGSSNYIESNCQGEEYLLTRFSQHMKTPLPYRSDNRKVCISQATFTPDMYSSFSKSGCNNFASPQESIEAFHKVIEGSCKSLCYDSDGGNNIDVAGFVSLKGVQLNDSCWREDIIKEAVCRRTILGIKPYYNKEECPTGTECVKNKEGMGACVNNQCNKKSYKFAFVILGRDEDDITQERIDKLTEVKNKFGVDFKYATSNLATADVSYPVKVIIDDGSLMNPEKTDFYSDKIAQKFLESNPDVFDFIISFVSFPLLGDDYNLNIDYNIYGIGKDDQVSYQNIIESKYGTKQHEVKTNQLKSIISLTDVEGFDPKHSAFYAPFYSNTILHEVGHHWCCFVGDNFNEGKDRIWRNIILSENGGDEYDLGFSYHLSFISEKIVKIRFQNTKLEPDNIEFIVSPGDIKEFPFEFIHEYKPLSFKVDEITFKPEGNSYVTLTFTQKTSLEIIQEGIHFYKGLQSPSPTGDPMKSDYWVSNEDGTYRRENQEGIRQYHPFHLYFMGLLTKDNYDFNKKFKVYNAGVVGENFNDQRATFYKEVSINDIIQLEGERRCG